MGLGFGFVYDYHHYGPFCAEIAFAADDAEALNLLTTEERQGVYGMAYTIYRSTSTSNPASEPRDNERTKAMRRMAEVPSIVLELAATAVFLGRDGYDDCWKEVQRRKPLKAKPERIAVAKQLLHDLGLDS